MNVRRVEPRNTPTMINAVFNHSNFWDGRAHFLFNGVSPIGPLDPAAKIWVNNSGPGSAPVQAAARFDFSSLASQAVGPPTSDLEMSFFNRPFAMIGRKLLSLTPLGLQVVDPTDSVLGSLSNFPNPGLTTTYSALIQAAFAGKYWNGANVGSLTHMEANFTLFWGLAVQRYEQTLVSDRTPFDRFMEGSNAALTEDQLQGLLVFLNQGPERNPPEVDSAIAAAEAALGVPIGVGNCVACHSGPEFTSAAFTSLAGELIEIEDAAELVDGLLQPSETQAAEDAGFANIGVRPTRDDLGRGGEEGAPGGPRFPLSFTRQALARLNFLQPAGMVVPAGLASARTQVDGAFKIPGLRNVELTGPYFHNGGQATLTQVIEFYDRQSDFGDVNINNLDGEMAPINLGEPDEQPLVGFLLSLTDERVRQEQAPFDHPQIFVPAGGLFVRELPRIESPAVGAGGRPAKKLKPLGTFLGLKP
jgi:cytochrome c peroxidase